MASAPAARAVSGHIAAAPPSSVMNSRRFMSDMGFLPHRPTSSTSESGGWARSFIRSSEQREILFDLENARRDIFDSHGKTPTFDQLSKCSANLLRMWAEIR